MPRPAPLRAAIAAAATVAAVFALPAAAAVPPACQLVKDRLGDAGPVPDPTGQIEPMEPSDPALDVRSADVGVTPSYLTTVIRVGGLPATFGPDPQAPLGRGYALTARITGVNLPVYTRLVARPFDVPRAEWGFVHPLFGPLVAGPARAVVDAAAGEVRVSVLLDAVPALQPQLGNGGVFYDKLSVQTQRLVDDPTGTPTQLEFATSPLLPVIVDTAVSDARYEAGRPTCVRVGR